MQVELIRIGNSRGVRIPKPIIQQCGLGDTVELRVENSRVVIAPSAPPRSGWEERFRAAASATKDKLLLEPMDPSKFDESEWEW